MLIFCSILFAEFNLSTSYVCRSGLLISYVLVFVVETLKLRYTAILRKKTTVLQPIYPQVLTRKLLNNHTASKEKPSN